MKNMILLLIVTFILASCGNRAKTNSAVEEISTPVVEETATATETIEESQPMPTVSEEVGSVNKSKDDSSAEWDALLNDYEQYIDSYISCLKKASNGDMTAMTEYMTLLEKAQSMTEKIEKISNNLTPAQSQRYLKLNQKLLNAASNF